MATGPGIDWEDGENAIHDWITGATGLANDHVIWYGQNNARPTTPFIEMKWGVVRKVGIDGLKYDDRVFTFSPVAITGASGNVLAAPAHGLSLGDGPFNLTGVSLPPPLAQSTPYWAIPVDADHLSVASTFLLSRRNTSIVLTGGGTGTIVSISTTRKAGAELNRRAQGMRKVTLTLQCFGTSGIGGQGADQLLATVIDAHPLFVSSLVAVGVGVLQTGQVQAQDGVVNKAVFEPRAVVQITCAIPSEVVVSDTYIERASIQTEVDGVDGPDVDVDAGDEV